MVNDLLDHITMEAEGQGGDTGNGEVRMRTGCSSLQEGRRSRTPASGAEPERLRTQSPGVTAAVPQSQVGLVDEREREFRELVAQLEDSIYELSDLDELVGYDERRRDHSISSLLRSSYPTSSSRSLSS